MSLFIKQIADKFAGQVSFSLPDCNGGYVCVAAFLSEDPVIKMGNKWEALIPDLNTLNDFMQLAGRSPVSWLSTSKAAWKGTDPITVSFNFYLITYSKAQVDGTGKGQELPITKQASYFAQLAAVGKNTQGGFLGDMRVDVHGGYKPNYFVDNSNVVNNGNYIQTIKNMVLNDKDGAKANSDTKLASFAQGEEGDAAYTCDILVNGNGHPTLHFRKMLLESVEFTPSTVRAGYWNAQKRDAISNIKTIGSGTFTPSSEPLYIKVNASFRLMHVTTIEDAAMIFLGGKSL